MRTIRRDLSEYNKIFETDEAVDETGWKLVHGDVFRPPRFPILLSSLFGSGVQFLSLTFATLTFSVLGLLSPANRGSLLSSVVFLFIFLACLGGFFASQNYKKLGGTSWKLNAVVAATLVPGSIFAILFILNLFFVAYGSSAQVPITSFLLICFMWFGISIPLSLVGAYFGWRKSVEEFPRRVNRIPRCMPPQPWYMHPVCLTLVGGLFPFCSAFLELFFIFTAIWSHQIYYMFGFLFLVFFVLSITTAEICILVAYFQLCAENFHWWWQSFATGASSGFYLLLFTFLFYFSKLEIDGLASTILYFGYSIVIVIAFFTMCGTIGYYACLRFVILIYGALKVE